MIGDFTLKTYDDKNKLITSTNPITVGKSIYSKITASNLPASLTYQVLNCEVQNTGNVNWKANSEFIKLWQNQTCLNNDMQAVGINGGNLDSKSNVYAFDFKAFTFRPTKPVTKAHNMSMVSFLASKLLSVLFDFLFIKIIYKNNYSLF